MLCACVLVRPAVAAAAQSGSRVPPQSAEPDESPRLVLAVEYSIRAGDDAALRALVDQRINRAHLSEFALSMTQTKVSDVTVKERDRAPLASGGQRLLLEILTVTGGEGRVWTWRLDALPGPPGELWMISDVERLTVVTGLFHVSLDTTVEWDVHNAVVTGPDLTL